MSTLAFKKCAAFTLLELLVVLIIIAVLFSLVSLNVGARPHLAKQVAQQMQQLFTLALDDAALRGQIIGCKIDQTSYEFYRYRNRQWLPLTKDTLLHKYNIRAELEYNLALGTGKSALNEAALPQILFFPDGSLTPFTLTIRLKNDPESYQVFAEQRKVSVSASADKKRKTF